MSIEKWLDENTCFDSINEEILIPLSAFQALMETHAIVPREPSENILEKLLTMNSAKARYKAMIKAAEKEQ